jgi:RNA polymerase sigma-70 factor (TIGR02954 family)
MGEEELVIAAQSGDNDAFYSLVSSYSENLYNIAYCYLKDQQEALEAVQETTCRAYVKLKKLKQPQYFKTWLTKILINYCIDEQKRRKEVIELSKEKAAEENLSPEDTIVLEEAVNKLDIKYKHVIILKYFQDMTISDIANVLECPEGTVKSWLHRALKLLKDSLNREGDFDVR